MAAFADEGYEQISDDDKLALASQFLLSSPPGEIQEVLTDIKVLCPSSILTDEVLAGVFRRYNNQSNQVITNGTASIICDESTEIDAEHYMDFTRDKVVKVDQLKQEIVDDDVADVAPVEVPSGLAGKREAVESALMDYVTAQYVKETTIVTVAAKGSDLVVLLSGEKLNMKNFWGGRWHAKYVIDTSSGNMDGAIKLRIHYFEDGNVQMTTEKSVDNVPISTSGSDDALAKAVKNAIAKEESAVQDSLEEMYINMSKETFKDMRRVLPITRTKFDWSGQKTILANAKKG